jgi:hypothetical protein
MECVYTEVMITIKRFVKWLGLYSIEVPSGHPWTLSRLDLMNGVESDVR